MSGLLLKDGHVPQRLRETAQQRVEEEAFYVRLGEGQLRGVAEREREFTIECTVFIKSQSENEY